MYLCFGQSSMYKSPITTIEHGTIIVIPIIMEHPTRKSKSFIFRFKFRNMGKKYLHVPNNKITKFLKKSNVPVLDLCTSRNRPYNES